jgi:hypothetical protein
VKKDSKKQTHFHNAYNNCGSHKVRSPVKHLAAVVCPYACVDAHMNHQEGNKKQTGQTHHYLLPYCRSEKIRPFHVRGIYLGFWSSVCLGKL